MTSTRIIDAIRRRGPQITGLVAAAIALATAFGLPLSAEQQAAILGFVGAILALVAMTTTANIDVVERRVGASVKAGPANDLVPSGETVRSVEETGFEGDG